MCPEGSQPRSLRCVAPNILGIATAFSLLAVLASCATETRDPRFQASSLKPPLTAEIEKELGPLRFRGAVTVTRAGERFRGWSGLWVSLDGSRFAAVEGGEWAQGALSYDADGNLASLAVQAAGPLLDEKGQPFVHDDDKDAEALDFDGSRFLVGFETHDRVLAYRSFTSAAERIELPTEAYVGIPRGAGFSSVAHLPNGSTIVLPEYTADDPQNMRVSTRTRGWLLTKDGAGPVWLRKARGLPVSLSAFPNGDLLLLEVQPTRGKITDTRLSRIAANSIAIGGTLRPRQIATLRPPFVDGRFEGSAVRRGARGETLLYLMINDSPAALYLFELTDQP
jgi:hypothetical protein